MNAVYSQVLGIRTQTSWGTIILSTTNGVYLSVIEMCCPRGQSYESLSSTPSPESLILGTAALSCVLGPPASTPVLVIFFLVILLVYQAACLTYFSLDMLGERQSQLINSGCIIKIKNNNTKKRSPFRHSSTTWLPPSFAVMFLLWQKLCGEGRQPSVS